MLREHEKDCRTGMDAAQTAEEIRRYTEGYPFPVSRICQELDKAGLPWDKAGVQLAVKTVLMEKIRFLMILHTIWKTARNCSLLCMSC